MKTADASSLHFPRELSTDLSRVKLRQLDEISEPLHTEGIERNRALLERSGLHAEAILNPSTDAHRMAIWDENAFAGGFYITPLADEEDRNVEISYWIEEARQGRRLGRVAVNAAVRYLVNDLGVDVHASVLASNTASQGLLQKLKFEPTDEYGTEFVRRSPIKQKLGATATRGMQASHYKFKRRSA